MRNDAAELFRRSVRELLTQKGWTYEELGRRARLSTGNISNYLKGKTIPGLKVVDKIARAFEVSPHDLFAIETSPERKIPPHSLSDCMKTVRELLVALESESDSPLVRAFISEIKRKN